MISISIVVWLCKIIPDPHKKTISDVLAKVCIIGDRIIVVILYFRQLCSSFST